MPTSVCRDCCETAPQPDDRCPACGSTRVVSHAEIDELTIAHIDCDAFYASVEKRDAPELRDRPLIVGHPGGRGVVTTACYIARRYGVRSAMPMFQALERCAHAVVIAPDMGKYKRVSDDIRAIFHSVTDIIEPVSMDEAYLDLSPEHCNTDLPPAQALATIASRVESEVRITVSIGLAPNKFLAKLASDIHKPRGYSIIGRAEARAFLAPLPVAKINGVGAVTAAKFDDRGIRTIADLQAMSEQQLVAEHGKFGRRLAQFAHGEDDRRVTPDRPTKSISAETTLRRDTGSTEELSALVGPMCERLASQLSRKSLAGAAVVLKLKTSDFKIVTRTRRLANPTQRADVLQEAALALLVRETDGRTFRLLGVGADQLCPATLADPPDLFGKG